MTTPVLTTCTLDVAGMTCASCVRRVEKALTGLKHRWQVAWPRVSG
jgi:Cu+-exporting ATPase